MNRSIGNRMEPLGNLSKMPRTLLVGVLVVLGLLALGSRPMQGEMLILRGVAGDGAPRGLLDDESALEYAQEVGYQGDVLDIAGDDAQIPMALERIRADRNVRAIYGFSRGGYNLPIIWNLLAAEERRRIGKIVIVGSPGVSPANFPGIADITIYDDPPEGHMAGPRGLLQAVRQ